jgi:hypothetical protein
MTVQPTRPQTPAPPIGTARRALAGLEHAMRLTDAVVPFNVVVVLRLEGELAPSALRAALDTLQRRHPLLRAACVGPTKKPFFQFETAGPIPLEVCERPTPESWIAVAEEELVRRFDLDAGPLLRCRYLAGRSCGDLIVTFQHMIVDATSAVRFIGDLLSLSAGVTRGDRGNIPEEGLLPASALFPSQFKGVSFARAVAAFMGRQVADEIRFRWHSRGVRKPAITDTGKCRIIPIRFPAALTSALIQASRARRLTLNSVLGAGLLTAVQRCLYPSPRVPLRHLVFADLRPRLRTTIPDDMLGVFLTMIRFTVMVEREGDLWTLARDIQESTLRAERSGERHLAFKLSPAVLNIVLHQRAFRWCATAFSYSGPPDLPLEYGSFELKGIHAFPTNWNTGPEYSALARLFRGELWWDILYLDNDMDRAKAQEIAREVQAILTEATC